ncbi:NudC domain-containing protein 3-like protein [Leptotrombidium deliense]|uniref:NudC domain-containing protein 3-like protein n=1 Tax=Leptotrombidium deliense TaxID=299467 RepID=A0A443SW11_9ACAR|nr:NudC domain-containing protein 3-like protein [Leptotrombidium deliense]
MDNDNEHFCLANMSAEQHILCAVKKEAYLDSFLDKVFRVLKEHTDFYEKYTKSTVLRYVSKYATGCVCGDKPKPAIMPMTREVRECCHVSLKRPSNTMNTEEKSLSDAIISSEKSFASNESAVSVDEERVGVRTDRDDYNGATCQEYSWSQVINEIDVIVPIESCVSSSRQVRVFIRSDDLTVLVNVGGNWIHKVNGCLSYTIRPMNSMWTLHPNSHIHISLEKERELWWSQLIQGEKALRVGSKDRSVQFEHLSDEAQTLVQKLAYEQYLKSKQRN